MRIASESRFRHAKRATPTIFAFGALFVHTVLANRAVDACPSLMTIAHFGFQVEIASIRAQSGNRVHCLTAISACVVVEANTFGIQANAVVRAIRT